MKLLPNGYFFVMQNLAYCSSERDKKFLYHKDKISCTYVFWLDLIKDLKDTRINFITEYDKRISFNRFKKYNYVYSYSFYQIIDNNISFIGANEFVYSMTKGSKRFPVNI